MRELGELPGVTVSVAPDELDLDIADPTGSSAALAESDRRVRGNLVAMNQWLSAMDGPGRRLRVRFWLRPVEILQSSAGTVGGLRLERTHLTSDGVFEGTGEFETLDAQMVLRSVGYQSVPLDGVPFDTRSCTVPNDGGRVLGDASAPLPGEYVAGWLKRGPTGVIGTNKADAAETVRALLEPVCVTRNDKTQALMDIGLELMAASREDDKVRKFLRALVKLPVFFVAQRSRRQSVGAGDLIVVRNDCVAGDVDGP